MSQLQGARNPDVADVNWTITIYHVRNRVSVRKLRIMATSNVDSNEDVISMGNVSVYLQNGSGMRDLDLLDRYNNEIFIYKLPAIVYTGVMMLLGIPGNIIVFYVYFSKWRRSTSRMFILFLAALDTLNCSTTLPMEIYIMSNSLKLDNPFLCKMSRYSTYVMNSSSALVLLGIAADRFKRICRPYQRSFSENKSKYISICAILFSVGTTWPSLILYGTRNVDLGKVNGSACLLENKYDNTPYPLAFFSVMITTTMLVFASLIILYYFVGLQIYKHRKFKLKNCTHVQTIVDDKSVTVRSEKSNGDKSKSSNNVVNEGKEDPVIENGNVMIAVNEPTDVNNEDNENDLKPYQLGLPAPCPDVGTSCGLLDIHCEGRPACSDLSIRNVSFDSRITSVQLVSDLNNEPEPVPKKSSPQPKKPKVKRKTKRVRYLLVRGSSTLNASGRAKCVNCLTVRIGRSTLMLFLITIAYVVSFLPFYIIVIIRQSNIGFVSRMSKGGLMAYHVFLRSYLLSSAVNPFIYSFCNAQFREYCKDAFTSVLSRRRPSFINRSKISRPHH